MSPTRRDSVHRTAKRVFITNARVWHWTQIYQKKSASSWDTAQFFAFFDICAKKYDTTNKLFVVVDHFCAHNRYFIIVSNLKNAVISVPH